MLALLDECAEAVKRQTAVVRERAAADSAMRDECEVVFDVIRIALGKENQAVLQAGRGDNFITTPFEELAEHRGAIAERRLQMEGDLDIRNGEVVACVMLADYGGKKAGEAGFVPASEVDAIPCRRLTPDEIANWEDPCTAPYIGEELRIAGMLHGGA